jgi:hypothetical protein
MMIDHLSLGEVFLADNQHPIKPIAQRLLRRAIYFAWI